MYHFFPDASIEEEGRLTNRGIREHFLLKLFTNLRFGKIKNSEMKDLVEFHARHKFILMTYSQKELKNLGRIVANHEKLSFAQVIEQYQEHLAIALANPPRINNSIT